MLKLFSFSAIAYFAALAAACACNNGPPLQTSAVPPLPGRAVFQGAGQLWLFDFASLAQSGISQNWGLNTLRNPQFSPDGKFVVFSGVNSAGTVRDVYVWPVGAAAPQNLTRGGASGVALSDDPKWRPDEKAIVFKQDGNIKVLRVTITGTTVTPTGALIALTANGVNHTATEASAPFYSPDGKYVYFTRNFGAAETVKVMAAATGQASEAQFSANGTYAYYPAPRDYTAIFYTGWTAATGANDQILYQVPLTSGTTVFQAAFNDCGSDNSDPAPVDADYVLYSDDNPALANPRAWRPLLGSYRAAQAWDLSRIGLAAGVSGDILGMNYTAAR